MLFYFIRHAEPIYDPDSITERGKLQAEALSERLYEEKIDRVFSSSSTRALMTAEPTCKKLGLSVTAFDWAREDKAGGEFGLVREGKWNWLFCDRQTLADFNSDEVRLLGDKWYEHKKFDDLPNLRSGIQRIAAETDAFFSSLGYVHDRNAHIYRVENPTDEKIAFFAHGGFGMAFLSSFLDIPYNIYSLHFEHHTTTGMTIISFNEVCGTAVPKIVEYCNDSHLYKAGLKPYNQHL